MSEESGSRQTILAGIAGVAFLVAVIIFWRSFQDAEPVRFSKNRTFMCAKTGKAYEYTIKIGDKAPFYCSASGANTGYRAELCYWTKDENGEWKAKLDPTPVLLRSIFEPGAETVCPDCGHDVVGHNPQPPPEMMEAARLAAGQ